ncbi:MAG: hypothetical protein Q9183_005739 [Haloplaca sp. 2 TL-2023]
MKRARTPQQPQARSLKSSNPHNDNTLQPLNARTQELKDYWRLRLASNIFLINPIARSQFPRLGTFKELRPVIDKLGFNAESVLGEALRCTSVQRTLAAIDEINGRFRGWLYGEKENGMFALHAQCLGMLLIVRLALSPDVV